MDSRRRTACIGATAIVVLSTLGCAHGVHLRSMTSGASPASRYVTSFMLPGNASANPDVDRQLSVEVETALADTSGIAENRPRRSRRLRQKGGEYTRQEDAVERPCTANRQNRCSQRQCASQMQQISADQCSKRARDVRDCRRCIAR
jgi:hypothetical protein